MRAFPFLFAAGALCCVGAAAVCRSPLNEQFETPCSTTVAAKGPVSVRRYGATEAVTLVITDDAIRKNADKGWTLWMAAAHSQFPDGPGRLPKPGQYEELQALPLNGSTGQGRDAYFAVVNFTTPSLPLEADWVQACALAKAPGALPRKFELDSGAPFPDATLALYELAGHDGPWTSECWVGVRPV